MKAILVIDTPKDCWDCHLVSEFHSCRGTVLQNDFGFKDITNFDKGERPSWCPLRPLPHKLQADWYTEGYKEGFNSCLEEITGETE